VVKKNLIRLFFLIMLSIVSLRSGSGGAATGVRSLLLLCSGPNSHQRLLLLMVRNRQHTRKDSPPSFLFPVIFTIFSRLQYGLSSERIFMVGRFRRFSSELSGYGDKNPSNRPHRGFRRIESARDAVSRQRW
jgi:hypothetical protein